MTEESSAIGIRRQLAENDEDLVKALARRERLLRAATAAEPGEQPEDADELAGRARNLALVHGLDPQVADRVWRAMLAGFASVHRGEVAGS